MHAPRLRHLLVLLALLALLALRDTTLALTLALALALALRALRALIGGHTPQHLCE